MKLESVILLEAQPKIPQSQPIDIIINLCTASCWCHFNLCTASVTSSYPHYWMCSKASNTWNDKLCQEKRDVEMVNVGGTCQTCHARKPSSLTLSGLRERRRERKSVWETYLLNDSSLRFEMSLLARLLNSSLLRPTCVHLNECVRVSKYISMQIWNLMKRTLQEVQNHVEETNRKINRITIFLVLIH